MENEIINLLVKNGAINKSNAIVFPIGYTYAPHFYDEKLNDTIFVTKLWYDARNGVMANYVAQKCGVMHENELLFNNPCLSYDEIILAIKMKDC